MDQFRKRGIVSNSVFSKFEEESNIAGPSRLTTMITSPKSTTNKDQMMGYFSGRDRGAFGRKHSKSHRANLARGKEESASMIVNPNASDTF